MEHAHSQKKRKEKVGQLNERHRKLRWLIGKKITANNLQQAADI